MTIEEIIKHINDAATKLLELEGNSEVRDKLIAASSNLLLLYIYAKGNNISGVLDILQQLISNEDDNNRSLKQDCL